MADDDEFALAVEDGLKLAKRIYVGRDRHMAAVPVINEGMERGPTSLQPAAPMVYAVISDPGIVDNPDLPSYQPHVYGRAEPPALIPLHMSEIGLEVECFLDSAFVTVRGRWRVHCVMRSRTCDCRLVVPMGEQGSILGIEADIGKRSYSTRVIKEENQNMQSIPKNESGGLLKPQLFSLTIPQVDGGSDITITVRWSQKLLYEDGQFSISIPFNFPEYVNPFSKLFKKREKIQLNVNSGIGKEVLLQRTSHALKEKSRQGEKLTFLYEADVEHWSKIDFYFSYSVYSGDLFGGVLIQSPSLVDFDHKAMFCLYLFLGSSQNRKVFRKDVVFVVDISGSMQGKPLENLKIALSAALGELTPGDRFNVIAFNDELHSFSSCLEPATEDMLGSATQWISKSFVAEGGTDIMHPLKEAIGLLSSTRDSLPHIFVVTDGAVEDESNICHTLKSHVANKGSMSLRISAFGIGSYCNHYFLRMLAMIGRGQYDAAYDPDLIETRMLRWFKIGLSPIVADITVDIFSHLDELEVYPFPIPDLSAGCPLIISGRYQGEFPNSLQAKGCLADMSDISIDLRVQITRDIPLEKVFAKQHIDLLTAQAWFSESKELEEKVTKLSIQNILPSEYTLMILFQTGMEKQGTVKKTRKFGSQKHADKENIPTLVRGVTIGFGNKTATQENLPTAFGALKKPENFNVYNKAASCCGRLADCFCCMCCIKMCSKLNDQCCIAITQLCTALSCLACFECCSELCCDSSD